MLLLGAAAIAYHLAAGRAPWWVFSIYPLTYVWFVAQRPSQLPRWVYPAAPFAAVAACAALVALIDWVASRAEATSRPVPRTRLATALVLLFFAPVLWATSMNLSRQLSPPTYTLAERWIADNAAPGDRILLHTNWLELDRRVFTLNRQRALEEVLDGGRYELAANDWIVVHEALLQHEGLARLRLAERVSVDPSFTGNQGPDFAIYRPLAIEPAELPLQVSFDVPEAGDYLGHRWPPRRRGEAGRRLPAGGAGLFLPPLGGDSQWLDIFVAPSSEPVALRAASHGNELRLQHTVEEGRQVFTTELSLPVVGPGVIEVTLQAADGGQPRILGFALRSE